MHFLCLTGIYNHHQDLTNNAIACFLTQDHPTATMLLLDDRPANAQFPADQPVISRGDRRVEIVRFGARCSSLMAKYDAGIDYANSKGIAFDAVSVWDGDDAFLPRHLSISGGVLYQHKWCYPSVIYNRHAGFLQKEATGQAKCWSCITLRAEFLKELGGFGHDPRMGFDQAFVSRAKAACEPGDTGEPTYVYRWADTASDHTSGHSDGFSCTNWYNRTPVQQARGLLVPRFDEPTEIIFQEAGLDLQEIKARLQNDD